MLQVTTTIDTSLDIFEDTKTRTRYVDYPALIECNQGVPYFDECPTCDDDYCHPYKSDSEISLQFILGNYEFADISGGKVQILDVSESIIKETDYVAITNDVDIVANEFTDSEGLRLSYIFKPSNFTEDCFYVRGVFTISGIDFEFTSQKFCRARCSSLLKLESTYRTLGKDYLGAYYDGTYKNTLYLDADIELIEFQLNDVAYNSRGQKTYSKNWDAYQIRAVLNESAAKQLANVLRGTDIEVDGVRYFNDGLFSKDNEENGLWVCEVILYRQSNSDIKLCQ